MPLTKSGWGFLMALIGLIFLASYGFSLHDEAKSGKLPDWWTVHKVWAYSTLLIAFMAMMIGTGRKDRLLGIMIDSRNRYSLSKAQMTFWTILVLGTVFTMIIWNTAQPPVDVKNPKNILPFLNIPTFLWALMGISTISLIGSPLILKDKELAGELLPSGATPKDAKFSDLIFGEEKGSEEQVDLGRVQMLLISMVVGISYTVLIAAHIGEAAEFGKVGINGFPDMDGGLLGLIAISHVGYLSYKVIKK